MNPRVGITALTHGGDGVGRVDGKTVFVAGAVPGDLVEIEIFEERARFDRARVIRLVESEVDRIDPPCDVFGTCGGCRWQMVVRETQLGWKRDIVESQLLHLARLEVEVRATLAPGPAYGYRNRLDLQVDGGRFGLYEQGSHRLVTFDRCHLLATGAVARLADLATPTRGKVTVRAGIRTGETAMIGDGPGLMRGRAAVIHEEVAGRRFRISGRTFFQVNTDGADELVRQVDLLVGDRSRSDVLVDAYAGGGLFSATIGEGVGEVIGVESDRTAIADLRVNAPHARVVASQMANAFGSLPETVDLIVVDPPREGMGKQVVAGLVGLGARSIVSVSCDPASFARDARHLVDSGYVLVSVQPIDLFPQTPHIETVSHFTR